MNDTKCFVRTPARVPSRLHARVVKLSEDEELPVTRIYNRAIEHCLSLPIKTWLRKPRKEAA